MKFDRDLKIRSHCSVEEKGFLEKGFLRSFWGAQQYTKHPFWNIKARNVDFWSRDTVITIDLDTEIVQGDGSSQFGDQVGGVVGSVRRQGFRDHQHAVVENISGFYREFGAFSVDLSLFWAHFRWFWTILNPFEQTYCAFGTIESPNLDHCQHGLTREMSLSQGKLLNNYKQVINLSRRIQRQFWNHEPTKYFYQFLA